MNVSFQINLVLGIGGMVNLLFMYLVHEFSLGWFLFSLVLINGSNASLISLRTLHAQERKELVWTKHGIWTIGGGFVIAGMFKHGQFTITFIAITSLMIIAIMLQYGIYRYILKKFA